MDPVYRGKRLPSVFSTTDEAYHKALKAPVAQIFSMTSMRNFEPHADRCTDIFLKAMRDLQGQPVDFAVWLHWYAYDVIGEITFQRRFGFMEQRRDVDHMIKGIDAALKYAGVIGQVPSWHPCLVGNRTLMDFLGRLFPDLPDPLKRVLTVLS